MEMLTVLLILVHIAAAVAGGSNAVLNGFAGPMMHGASAETRKALYSLQDQFAKVGTVSTALLILTGLLVLWLKWDFTAPSAWFWVKMAGFAALIVCIVLGDRHSAAARSGGLQAGSAIAAQTFYGKLTTLCFLVVLLGAVATFR